MKILNKRFKANQGNKLVIVIADHSKEHLGLEIVHQMKLPPDFK